jgi:hypothetical protein
LIVPQGRPGNVLFNWAQGFRLSGILTYASAYPFNVLTGGQTLQTTSARVPGIGRNTGRGFNYVSADFRLSRGFRIREGLGLNLLAESFNTFNRVNLQFPNNIFGAGTTPLASFGKATAAADPRQLQFGLRLNF